jgi:polygalacturonase
MISIHSMMTAAHVRAMVLTVMATATAAAAARRAAPQDLAAPPWPLRQWPLTLGGGGGSAAAVDLASCGGVADGVSDNALAFHSCLARLARAGGGTLVVSHAPGGAESVYAAMPVLVNVSRVTLRLEAGVRLLGLCNISDWPTRAPWDSYAGAGWSRRPAYYAPFVHALNVTDFALEGLGVIDGQGACWWKANGPGRGTHGLLPYERPRLIVVEGSQRISLSGFTATMPGFWTIVLFQSSDIHVSNVTVRNPAGGVGPCTEYPSKSGAPCYGPNADGIDLVSVTRALVEGMDIIAGDDCFCVKSGMNAPGRAVGLPSRDIRFRNNIARMCSNPHNGGHADAGGGYKIGSDMSGGVFNVLFEDNFVGYAGMAIKVSTPVPRGGRVHNITFQRIEVAQAGMVIAASPIDGGRPAANDEAPQVSNITFRDIHVRNLSCVAGATAYGCEQHNVGWFHASSGTLYPLANITVRNVTAIPGDPTKPLTWDCSGPGTVFGEAIDVIPPLTCLGHA